MLESSLASCCECKCRRIALGFITNKINDENNIIVNNVIVNNVKYVDICEIVDANFVNKDGISSKKRRASNGVL